MASDKTVVFLMTLAAVGTSLADNVRELTDDSFEAELEEMDTALVSTELLI